MADEQDISGRRKPRADAERNRALLLETAKIVFAEKGSDASLDEIARRTGVGIGTLYRHFPTRDALIAAVYRNESEQLGVAAARLAETRPPVAALHEWLLLFVDYMATKQGMTEVLNSAVGDTAALRAASGEQMKQAIGLLVGRATASGEIRLDLDPLDLLRAIAGVANISAGPGWEQSAKRLVEVLVAGVQIRD